VVVVWGGYRLTTLPLPVDLVELLAFLAPWLDGAVDKVPKEFAMACDMNVGVGVGRGILDYDVMEKFALLLNVHSLRFRRLYTLPCRSRDGKLPQCHGHICHYRRMCKSNGSLLSLNA